MEEAESVMLMMVPLLSLVDVAVLALLVLLIISISDKDMMDDDSKFTSYLFGVCFAKTGSNSLSLSLSVCLFGYFPFSMIYRCLYNNLSYSRISSFISIFVSFLSLHHDLVVETNYTPERPMGYAVHTSLQSFSPSSI